jgi:hypothetical protein
MVPLNVQGFLNVDCVTELGSGHEAGDWTVECFNSLVLGHEREVDSVTGDGIDEGRVELESAVADQDVKGSSRNRPDGGGGSDSGSETHDD